MHTFFDNGRLSDSGFVYVASKDRIYYEMALVSAESMRDYYPDAHITLFTHQNFIDSRCEIFDRVIVNIPIHKRARMLCMVNTPYASTVSIDADSIISHRDVKQIHTHYLKKHDVVFGSHLDYTTTNIKWAFIDKQRTINVQLHGGVFGFNKSDSTIDFMQTWFDEYIKQTTTPWPYGDVYYKEWRMFDMFTLWRMTSGVFPEFDRFKDLNIGRIPRRFNSSWQDLPNDLDGPRAITLVDSGTWARVSNKWPQMKQGARDEKYQVKQPKVDSTVIEYN